jgi:guanylate kinase
MGDAINELSHYEEYDYLVINDEFELALSELQALIATLRENQRPQQADLSKFVTRLMANK